MKSSLALSILAGALPFAVELLVRGFLDPLAWLTARSLGLAAVIAVSAGVLGFLVTIGRDPRAGPMISFGLVSWLVLSVALNAALTITFGSESRTDRFLRWGLDIAIGAGTAAAGAHFLRRGLARRRGPAAVAAFGVAALIGAAVAVSPFRPVFRRADHRKPDVLLIVLDTLRADHLSLHGYSRRTTPELDRLAREALVYDNAWSPCPWTPSGHASIMTGLLPGEHECDGRAVRLDTAAPTLAEVLAAGGYDTVGLVNNPFLSGGLGWERGFGAYRGSWEAPGFSVAYVLWRLENRDERWSYAGDVVTTLESAARWWSRHGRRPRFVFINLIDPHAPYGDAPGRRDRFLDGRTRAAPDLPQECEFYDAGAARAEGAGLDRIVARYDADVFAMDRALGRFLDRLRRRGELDATLCIVTSDHGERLGERRLLGHQLGLDDVLLRVPLIVRLPERVAPGRVSTPVQTHGIFETVTAAAGVEPPLPRGARAPALERQTDPVVVAQMRYQEAYVEIVRSRVPSFDPAPFAGDWMSASDGRWKLVRSTSGWERLYDVYNDPAEECDLLAEHPEHAARLRPRLDALPGFDATRGKPSVPEGLNRQLRGLGYVQ